MRIVKDGSVFRIELDSGIQRFETRISFAVSSHGQMVRPRVEVEKNSLTEMFGAMLPHIQIEDLMGRESVHLWDRYEHLRQILRLLDAVVIKSTTDKEVSRAIPDDLRAILARWKTLRDL